MNLIGLCSLPSLSGLPLNSDVNFGNVVEGHSRSLTLSIYNEDISTSTITTDAETPFSIKPNFAILESSKKKKFKIIYSPIDQETSSKTSSASYTSSSSLNLTHGSTTHEMTTVGTCGTCELHSSATGNVINFGTTSVRQKKTCHFFLTNVGNLMLRMKSMDVSHVKHFDIRFVGLVPRSSSHNKMIVHNDAWSIIKTNLKRALFNETNQKEESNYYYTKESLMMG